MDDVRDNYTQPEGRVAEPPKTWRGAIRYLGPSVIISATIVGSGEIILTAGLGAAVGYAMLWWVLFSCWSKSILQAELARYIVLSGDTYLRALNRIPGRIPGPRKDFAWPIGLGLVGFATGLTGLGGLIGGAGLALSMVIDEIEPLYAVGGLSLLAAILLGTGHYRRIENIMLVFVVTFTVLTLTGAVTMQWTEFSTSPSDLSSGFAFDFRVEHAVLALAAYGYTGVNASEIAHYTYWCIEKGYPARIGRYDGSEAWFVRAEGWLRVLRADVWITLLLLTCATIPFYLLGAGVLHPLGQAPSGTETIRALSHMFTQTLGAWSIWPFAAGAFAILFSSSLAGVAAGARFIPDYLIELGYLDRESLPTREAIIRWYCLGIPFVGFGLYAGFERPVLMVTIAASYAAIMLPLQSGMTIYLQTQYLPARVRPKLAAYWLLRLMFLLQSVLAIAVIYFAVL